MTSVAEGGELLAMPNLRRAALRFLLLAVGLTLVPTLSIVASSAAVPYLPATSAASPWWVLPGWIALRALCQALVAFPAALIEFHALRTRRAYLFALVPTVWIALVMVEVQFSYTMAAVMGGDPSASAGGAIVADVIATRVAFQPESLAAMATFLLVAHARARLAPLRTQLALALTCAFAVVWLAKPRLGGQALIEFWLHGVPFAAALPVACVLADSLEARFGSWWSGPSAVLLEGHVVVPDDPEGGSPQLDQTPRRVVDPDRLSDSRG